jgi:hypothetical protein
MPASPKQFSANRMNAKLSTGPKTAAGKKAAGRNAVSHGFSTPALSSWPLAGRYRALAASLAAGDLGAQAAAQVAARCRFELDRIEGAKQYLITNSAVDIEIENPGHNIEFIEGYAYLVVAEKLANLYRYERRIRTKLRRALRACH